MNKAMAIERANNPHVPMPESCVVSREFTTRIIKDWQSPLPPGTVIVEAGDQAVLVKRSDLQLR